MFVSNATTQTALPIPVTIFHRRGMDNERRYHASSTTKLALPIEENSFISS